MSIFDRTKTKEITGKVVDFKTFRGKDESRGYIYTGYTIKQENSGFEYVFLAGDRPIFNKGDFFRFAVNMEAEYIDRESVDNITEEGRFTIISRPGYKEIIEFKTLRDKPRKYNRNVVPFRNKRKKF